MFGRIIINKNIVNLNITTINFPLPSIVSIIHRITGFILFIGIIFLFVSFKISLSSEEGFNIVKHVLISNYLLAKFIVWGLLSTFFIHLIGGIRHIAMDLHLFDNLKSGSYTSIVILIINLFIIILLWRIIWKI
ncbi:Succinate dehydrogenase cytochrome b556 subunit [Candidatus Johnevansia muelleri]|uniref:Succinate dehydrogenase cytochrome b556 subunit n=1 Tax=Candidatus Johnevansia muelleri TaxID=1495769 RepID=A0A078KB41_9GAMM|nr:Succinate dehydrogenase cytochrome b556 subunit [Candidatus Evansia muelleri]